MDYSIRSGTLEDAAAVVTHRLSMFRDMGYADKTMLGDMAANFDSWLRWRMESQEYLAWMAVDCGGSVIGGVGLWLMDWPPHPIGRGSRRGNILNTYVRPEFRRQGIARALMETALAWTRANGIDCIILHASEDGRRLYESLGFAPTNEMRLLG